MAGNSLRNASITLGIGIRGQGSGATDQGRRLEARRRRLEAGGWED
jgi:hypothetical protein